MQIHFIVELLAKQVFLQGVLLFREGIFLNISGVIYLPDIWGNPCLNDSSAYSIDCS